MFSDQSCSPGAFAGSLKGIYVPCDNRHQLSSDAHLTRLTLGPSNLYVMSLPFGHERSVLDDALLREANGAKQGFVCHQ